MSYSEQAIDIVALAAEDERRRLVRFQQAWQAYSGDAPKPLIPQQGEPDDNIRANFNRLIVDVGVSFLFGKPVSWTVDKAETEQDPSEKKLEAAWRRSGGKLTLKKLAKNGGVTGHVVAKLQPTPDGPRVIVVDPANFYPEWDDEDIDRLVRAELRWMTIDRQKMKPAVRRQRFEPGGEFWTIIDEIKLDGEKRWTTLGSVTHDFAWAPIFHCQNLPCPNEFWGMADLEDDTRDLVKSMERVLGRMNRILRLHSNPKPWVSGADASELKTLNGDTAKTWFFPNGETSVNLTEMSSDLASTVALYRAVKEAFHETGRLPEIATGKTEHADRLAGVALEILYQPLLEKTDDKRDTYGTMLETLSGRMLEMMDVKHESVALNWGKMLPVDTQSEAQGLETARRMGVVSLQTTSERLGFDWTAEQSRMEEEPEPQTVGEAILKDFDSGAGA